VNLEQSQLCQQRILAESHDFVSSFNSLLFSKIMAFDFIHGWILA